MLVVLKWKYKLVFIYQLMNGIFQCTGTNILPINEAGISGVVYTGQPGVIFLLSSADHLTESSYITKPL